MNFSIIVCNPSLRNILCTWMKKLWFLVCAVSRLSFKQLWTNTILYRTNIFYLSTSREEQFSAKEKIFCVLYFIFVPPRGPISSWLNYSLRMRGWKVTANARWPLLFPRINKKGTNACVFAIYTGHRSSPFSFSPSVRRNGVHFCCAIFFEIGAARYERRMAVNHNEKNSFIARFMMFRYRARKTEWISCTYVKGSFSSSQNWQMALRLTSLDLKYMLNKRAYNSIAITINIIVLRYRKDIWRISCVIEKKNLCKIKES